MKVALSTEFHGARIRESKNEPLLAYRMTRVTYGVVSSSFHAILSLSGHAKFLNTPEIANEAIERDLYVGDILNSAKNLEETKIMQTGLIETTKRGQYDVRKWA